MTCQGETLAEQQKHHSQIESKPHVGPCSVCPVPVLDTLSLRTSGLLHANHNARYSTITRLSFSSLSGRSPAGRGGSSSHFLYLYQNLTRTYSYRNINRNEWNHQLRQLLPNCTGTAMCPNRTQVAHPGLKRNPADLLCAKHRCRQYNHFPGCI